MGDLVLELNRTTKLTPLAQTILAHLRARGSISKMEALMAYGTSHLADAIYRLRKAGYEITSLYKKDGGGHAYTRYYLLGTVH